MLTKLISHHRQNPVLRTIEKYCKRYLEKFENLNYNILENGERLVLKALSRVGLSEIFDVGANVGEWALMARGIFPSARITCFEISPQTATILKKNVLGNDPLVINEFGLSDKNENISIRYFPTRNQFTTITSYPHEAEHVLVDSKVVRGDDYLRSNKIDKVDFLKIDVEGSEHLVLKGFEEAICEGKISIIQFEYGKVNILTKFLLMDFYEFFNKHNYQVGKIYPTGVEFRNYVLEHEDFIGPNYLAVHKSRTDLLSLLVSFE